MNSHRRNNQRRGCEIPPPDKGQIKRQLCNKASTKFFFGRAKSQLELNQEEQKIFRSKNPLPEPRRIGVTILSRPNNLLEELLFAIDKLLRAIEYWLNHPSKIIQTVSRDRRILYSLVATERQVIRELLISLSFEKKQIRVINPKLFI